MSAAKELRSGMVNRATNVGVGRAGAEGPELVAGSGHVGMMIDAMDEHGNLSTKGHVTRRAAHPITCTPLPFGDVLVASKKLKEKRREVKKSR